MNWKICIRYRFLSGRTMRARRWNCRSPASIISRRWHWAGRNRTSGVQSVSGGSDGDDSGNQFQRLLFQVCRRIFCISRKRQARRRPGSGTIIFCSTITCLTKKEKEGSILSLSGVVSGKQQRYRFAVDNVCKKNVEERNGESDTWKNRDYCQ